MYIDFYSTPEHSASIVGLGRGKQTEDLLQRMQNTNPLNVNNFPHIKNWISSLRKILNDAVNNEFLRNRHEHVQDTEDSPLQQHSTT
jgi:hypothetical protein